MEKSPEAFRTISEVAAWLDTPAHVLRFWESRFSQVKPVKRAGGRRYYRPGDMRLLGGIKKLLHEDGLTIRGVQKILREEGVRFVAELSPPLDDGSLIDLEAEEVEEVDVGPQEAGGGRPDAAAETAAETASAEEDAPAHASGAVASDRPAPEPDEAMLPGLDLHLSPPPGPTGTEARAAEEAAIETEEAVPAPDSPAAEAGSGPAETGQAGPPEEERPEQDLRPEAAERPAAPPEPEQSEPEQPEPEPSFRHSGEAAPEARPPAETQPEPRPETQPAPPRRPRPLGADLPATDPADDDPAFAPTAPPRRALVRNAALRRALASDTDRAEAVRERLRTLADRMDREWSGDPK
jgi:DNA-binding transcriptional MerR regulator